MNIFKVGSYSPQDRRRLKQRYGFEGKDLITTIGLIEPGKGIEIAIKAMKKLVGRHKNLMYLIVDRSDPRVVNREVAEYREMLTELVIDLGLEENVCFVSRALEPGEIGNCLKMTDIYLSPYPRAYQAISGTLAFAMGFGRAIVSIPQLDAQELMGQGKTGLVALQAEPKALAGLLDRILSEPDLKRRMENRSAKLGEKIKWLCVAQQYPMLAERAPKSNVVDMRRTDRLAAPKTKSAPKSELAAGECSCQVLAFNKKA